MSTSRLRTRKIIKSCKSRTKKLAFTGRSASKIQKTTGMYFIMENQVLAACRWAGLFWLAEWLTRRKLLILCYHGISTRDEHRWWPGVFMRESTFLSRLRTLKKKGYTVLSLPDALEAIDKRSLPKKSVVITADDGYINSPNKLVSNCEKFGYPITIYVTSYYSMKETPIFSVMAQYIFWKSEGSELPRGHVLIGGSNPKPVSLEGPEKQEYIQKFINFGKGLSSEGERQILLKKLASSLGFDYDQMIEDGMFMLMSDNQIRRLSEKGVDIQLHTHRHCTHKDKLKMKQEIRENREFLEPLTGKRLRHFCYPSGNWRNVNVDSLKEMDLDSAVTCDLGFVDSNSDKLKLNRFLDKETISDNKFLAEISGFLSIARVARKKVRKIWQ